MKFGLIGQTLGHSFSQQYFEHYFGEQALAHRYHNLEYPSIDEIDTRELLQYKGLNVTIPYKEAIIPLLDRLDPVAESIGAVNCIEVLEGKFIGHNTDAQGFRDSLRPFLKSWHDKALILGTGGASKAIAYVLDELGIEYKKVSRSPEANELSYDELNGRALEIFPFIINTTPLGMHPNIESCPDLEYNSLSDRNFLYDLTYNPRETLFLKRAKAKGAQTMNGLPMLKSQAKYSWEIWMNQRMK